MKKIEKQINILNFGKSPMKIKKPIRLIELFAGIGSQAMAFESLARAKALSIPVSTHKIIEFDPYAVKSYNAIHKTDFVPIDIRKIHGKDLDITQKDKYEYLMFYSFPCLVGDTLVMTKTGLVPIKHVQKGDMVLTHKNRWKPVTWSGCTGRKLIYDIQVGTEHIFCTGNHKFLVRYVEELLGMHKERFSWIPAASLDVKQHSLCQIKENGAYEYKDFCVRRTNQKAKVYDITVEKDHSFVVTNENICIHNCTDLSTAGLQKGMRRGSGTRSGLLWEVDRLLLELETENSLPQILCMENVPQVMGPKNVRDFNEWLRSLENLGYHNHYGFLNSNNFGIPQTRNRCFMISTLDDVSYDFPHAISLQRFARDMLEQDVGEKYYIKTKNARKLIKELLKREDVQAKLPWVSTLCKDTPQIVKESPCITTKYRGGFKISRRRNRGC